MRAVWHWPCALIALLLSGLGGLRSLPGDSCVHDEREARQVVSVVEVAPQAAAADRDLPRRSAGLAPVRDHDPRPTAVTVVSTVLRQGSALGPRAP